MSILPTDDAIARFKANEERVDIFVNDPLSTGYYTTNETVPRQVKTLPELADGIVESASLRADLVSNTAGKGAALVAFIGPDGNPYTVADLASDATGKGDALLRTKQPYTGAVSRTQHDKNRELVSVKDFGAVGDGTIDDGPAFNAAIKHCASIGGGKVIAPFATYKITTTILLPSNIELDLCNSILDGPGIGSATDLINTAYLDIQTSLIVSNKQEPADTKFVQHSSIKNATIKNCGAALYIYNAIDNCEFTNIKFTDCTYAVHSIRSWYSIFKNLFSRGSANSATNAAFLFNTFVNMELIESIFVTDRKLGIGITGEANGLTLYNCSAENCEVGIKIDRGVATNTGPVSVDTCYFEGCTVAGLELGASILHGSVHNCWFYSCVEAIKTESEANIHISSTNRFTSCGSNVALGSALESKSTLKIPRTNSPGNSTLSLPAGFTAGAGNSVNHEVMIFDTYDGSPLMKSKIRGDSLLAFDHGGNPGRPKTGTVAFCTHSKTAGTSFNVVVDTKISYTDFSTFAVFKFDITDNVATYKIFGFIFGDNVKQLDTTGKVVSIQNNGGLLRLTITGFSHPSEIYGCTGCIRHM